MKHIDSMTEPQMREYLSMLGAATESIMPGGPSKNGRALFAILVFSEPGMAHHTSNCDRGTMLQALREAADRLERLEDTSKN